MSGAELLSALGTPARAAARALLAPRYAIDGFQPLRGWMNNEYARARFGRSYMWRIWLLFDCKDLEVLEKLINDGQDEEVLETRDAKLKQFKLVTLVGALLATMALQALSLPALAEATFLARASFIVSTMLSLLATFFTLIQQRELGVIRDARTFRRWLSNGIQYYNARERLVWQSSLTSLTLVEAPYELMSLAVASFVAGMSAYVWEVWKDRLEAQKEQGLDGVAVVVYFAVATGFTFTMFPVLLGLKDREESVYRKSAEM
ncbi:hypothetical protein ACET3X_000863 [Alternaria dauci]|uniref:Uncharacterized protein n=1 Tax=Alternaria dauci TaxID=48095 RepID=A0ABR3UVM9_9PLEO